MADPTSGLPDPVAELLLRWARHEGVVSDADGERRLAAMRLEVLAGGALPHSTAADVALTAQWAAFICWVDDEIDRRGMGTQAGDLEGFTAPLRRVLTAGGEPATPGRHAGVLTQLLERTDPGQRGQWRKRFAAHYTDFLDATEEEVALRRAGTHLSPAAYVKLRRRTITVLPMLDVLERTGHTALVEDPGVDTELTDLRLAAADIAGWANDLASEADDQAVGQDNLVTVLARHNRSSADTARPRVAAMIQHRHTILTTTASSLRAVRGLPQDRREELRRYVDLVERFTAATLHWLAVTGRFAPDPVTGPNPSMQQHPTAPSPGPATPLGRVVSGGRDAAQVSSAEPMPQPMPDTTPPGLALGR
ncbi:terpene synthase family protein [Streptomyces kutzneri]|uniref:terpene synthase family protein n=1 Tax=Streptomyces kutzneri TaxID=3051179 RepID=UPI0028D124C6|nr:terpene synthase family protein [Streptomyces sp. DSM 40907]